MPWWLFGLGLHTQGSWNLMSWDLGTRIMLDFTYPFDDFAVTVGIGNERQALGYADTREDRDAPFYLLKVDFAGLMADVC